MTVLALFLAAACGGGVPVVQNGQLTIAAQQHDTLALSDALEELIAQGKDTAADRAFAYREASAREEATAAYAFARAAIVGRYVQTHGLAGFRHAAEVETWARRSRELDPGFRGGAATRMLGTLYVLAPASILAHGDSEEGLSLLEGLVKLHPEVPENHLRLAEALVALGDPAPAAPHLCFCLGSRASLRPDEQKLLDKLVKDAEMSPCPGAASR
ncbi:MAG: hypothetical protein ABI134_26170 [Byssovorax sp.]